MSPASGTTVLIAESASPRSSEADTGQAFFVGESERGPGRVLLARSLAEFVTQRGSRQSFSPLYDSVETAFREGAARIWTARVISSTADTAAVDLDDSDGDPTMHVEAAGPGEYGNAFKVIVITHAEDVNIPSGSFKLRIFDGSALLEETPTFATKQAAYDWSNSGDRTVVLSDLSSTEIPAAIAAPGTALSGGLANRSAIAENDWTAALDLFHGDLGSGQVAAPGRTTDAAHTALLAHAEERRRHALLDLPDSSTLATVTGSARSADSGLSARWGSAYWPWAIVPGLTPGTLRTVPYSAVQAGLCARVDARGNPNVPVAGEQNGAARFARGLSQDVRSLSDDDLAALNDAGVNVARVFFAGGGPVTYGNRTLRLKSIDPDWFQASGSRCIMAIAARGDIILRRFVHSEIDGKGRQQAQLGGELAGMLGQLYELGALYGDKPADAFSVDTGPAINTPDTIAAGELHALIQARVSPGAERVILELVRVSIQEVIG